MNPDCYILIDGSPRAPTGYRAIPLSLEAYEALESVEGLTEPLSKPFVWHLDADQLDSVIAIFDEMGLSTATL